VERCNANWLHSVLAAIRRHPTTDRATLADLGLELSHLAWSDLVPKASAFAHEEQRFRRHPLAGSEELGCSALVMYWPPGHATLPHDHGGLWGIEVVLDGELHVEEFLRGGSADAPELARSRAVQLGIGDLALFTSPRYVHRCRNLSNVAATLTLHVYGGALDRYLAYENENGGIRAQTRIAVSDAPLE
jgi:predicted metal-dependent enzyme (double-stranded beta helix superfamily)